MPFWRIGWSEGDCRREIKTDKIDAAMLTRLLCAAGAGSIGTSGEGAGHSRGAS
jgi:hypothetical protein